MTGMEKAKLFSVLSKARSRVYQMVSRTVKLKARGVILHAYDLTMELPATGYYGCSKFTSSRGPTGQNSGGDTLSTAKGVDRTTDLRSHWMQIVGNSKWMHWNFTSCLAFYNLPIFGVRKLEDMHSWFEYYACSYGKLSKQ